MMAVSNEPKDINVTLTLFPDNFTNSIFESNLIFFKSYNADIHNAIAKHHCKKFKICSNPDGSPNILDLANNRPLYNLFTREEINQAIDESVRRLNFSIKIESLFLGIGDERWKQNNPIQYKMLQGLYDGGTFHNLRITPDSMNALKKYSSDFIPLIRIYGIGLGLHLTELIKQKNISFLSIYEPNVDLFYTSLFTTPWKLVFQYFQTRSKGINLIIGKSPEEALNEEIKFLSSKMLSLTTYFFTLTHLNSSQAKEVVSMVTKSDEVARKQSDSGWYEDQKAGLYFSARNIRNQQKHFSGRKTKLFFRAFIVGSGPSLNESINYIKKYKDNAIIVSCGSAITPLLKAEIIPDFEIVQERVWHLEKHEQKHDLEKLKQVTLLKLNVVSPKIDKFYKNTLVFQKYRDPGSSLLDSSFPFTTAVNPTVTNAGISMCADLGVDEVYLFGVDYGAPLNSETMHASNTFYDGAALDDRVQTKTKHDLTGNLGATIRTDDILLWSLITTEDKIREFPHIKWVNVGEGAKINGCKSLDCKHFPDQLSPKIKKNKLLEDISKCFNNNYSTKKILAHLQCKQAEQVKEYFQALLGFTESNPKTKEEIIYVLSLIDKAINTGKHQTNYLPSSLLSYGFKQFIVNIYLQSSLADNNESAAIFFEQSKIVLTSYIQDIYNDFQILLTNIEKENDIEMVKDWQPFS
ncbi:6-hydroxymethylpterin diphosphokinase MptE-like protein [Desulforhopalus sp. IMCC35007]|uniref:motility associated factor glycosyltransferase family protein n=1 Tax=Desulforhopalus sp. IMCC35007 TaxID=2569543 RepID=UPI0010ADDE05|nr:6-hydroxymethylpterin diphosphokinase MptE-like protein [Desulforhopalus sp. IMCC35007]TKB10256.1 motility associated factor glycosyltransferase family protein [Desulforhopalus sp. IMCC35007]